MASDSRSTGQRIDRGAGVTRGRWVRSRDCLPLPCRVSRSEVRRQESPGVGCKPYSNEYLRPICLRISSIVSMFESVEASGMPWLSRLPPRMQLIASSI